MWVERPKLPQGIQSPTISECDQRVAPNRIGLNSHALPGRRGPHSPGALKPLFHKHRVSDHPLRLAASAGDGLTLRLVSLFMLFFVRSRQFDHSRSASFDLRHLRLCPLGGDGTLCPLGGILNPLCSTGAQGSSMPHPPSVLG